MKPTLSEKERAALMMLGKKNPEELQPFDTHIRGEIGRLSMSIEQGNQKIAAMETELAETKGKLTQDIGAFEATARTYLAYVGVGNVAPGPGPQEAPAEPGPDSGAPTQALVVTPQETPEEAPVDPNAHLGPDRFNGDDSPEPEAD